MEKINNRKLIAFLLFVLLFGVGCQTTLAQLSYYDSTRMSFSFLDFLFYYYYFVDSRYADYAWVVRSAWQLLLASCTSGVICMLIGLNENRKYNRGRKYLIHLLRHGKEHLYPLLFSTEECQVEDMFEAIQKTMPRRIKKLKDWQKDEWMNYLVILKQHEYDRLDDYNLGICTMALELPAYVEKKVSNGSSATRKIWLRRLEYINIPLVESTLVTQLHHRNQAMRLYSRSYYMRHSTNDPYRFLATDDVKDSLAFAMELRHTLEYRHALDEEMPDLAKYAAKQPDKQLRATLLRTKDEWEQHLLEPTLDEATGARAKADKLNRYI